MDDFAPRYEYPESMRKLEEYCKRVKASGMKYGDYVKEHPDAPQVRPEEKKTRICRKCGKEFKVKLQKDGKKYERWTSCEDCRGVQKEYHLICQRCGVAITGKTKNRKHCTECARILNRERVAQNEARKKAAKHKVKEV